MLSVFNVFSQSSVLIDYLEQNKICVLFLLHGSLKSI